MATPTNLLIDSHVLLWGLFATERLGPQANLLLRQAPVVYVSAATILELTIKDMIGKLVLPESFDDQLKEEAFTILPITSTHARAIRDFPELAKHDPFDRLLLAQATTEKIQFLTADPVLLGLGRKFIINAAV